MSKIDIFKLGDPNAKAQPRFAEIASAPGANEWQPGKKLWLSKYPPVAMSAELQRVLALPRRPQLDLESPRARALADLITDRYTRGPRQCRCAQIDPKIGAGKKSCPKKLHPIQAWTLYELGITGGILGSIPIGSGKSFLDILAPLALEPFGVRHSLLLVPPTLLEQLERDYLVLAEHYRVPAIFIHGLEKRYEVPGAPKLHVLPYSRLSMPASSNWIRNLRPEAIIADECDRLRDPNGAATSRVLRFYNEFGDTRFAGWTGSLTEDSIANYAHLAALALRLQSPLPLDENIVTEWARALDETETPAPPGELGRLCEIDEALDPSSTEDAREGYRRRLAETMGIIISTAASVDVDVIIDERKIDSLPPIILEALDKVRSCWVRPDTLAGAEHDEELVDAMQVARCARELASGIFYRWRFPPIRGIPQRKSDIDEWFEARKEWNRELRRKLASRDEWLDSPHLCENAAQRFHGDRPKRDDRPEWNSSTWTRWRDIKSKVAHETEAIRVSDYLVVDAARWALEHRGIVWYGMAEFGKWVSEVSGLPLHGGGPGSGSRIDKEIGDRSIVASMNSHGRGRDGLQSLFAEQLIAQAPASNTRWQQVLGRLWRQGQQANEVRAWYYAHTEELKESFDTALRRAHYVRGTLGDRPVLLR